MASGWMQVRQRARQKNVELPPILSDHADRNELIDTPMEISAREVWVTHGREEARYTGALGDGCARGRCTRRGPKTRMTKRRPTLWRSYGKVH